MSGSETGSEGAERGGGRRGGDLASKTLLLVNIPANNTTQKKYSELRNCILEIMKFGF